MVGLMAHPAPSRPPTPRTRGQADLGPVLWYVNAVIVSLALMSGSWRTAPVAATSALFAPVMPVAELPEGVVVQDVTRTASRPARARVRVAEAPGLADALRALAPREGEGLLIDSETLWLARCIYSESDLPHEQELVGWVVRNRVATAYRGRWTYEGVVLDDRQFSAFNVGNARRGFYLGLEPEDAPPGWHRALLIASYVRRAPWSWRPFDVTVRHFYSEVSMVGRRHPTWAIGETPVRPNRPYDVDPLRFRFLSLSREV